MGPETIVHRDESGTSPLHLQRGQHHMTRVQRMNVIGRKGVLLLHRVRRTRITRTNDSFGTYTFRNASTYPQCNTHSTCPPRVCISVRLFNLAYGCMASRPRGVSHWTNSFLSFVKYLAQSTNQSCQPATIDVRRHRQRKSLLTN